MAPSLALSLATSRAPIQLGSQIAAGGEGTIYTINNMPDKVAKIYRHPNAERAQKLAAMVSAVTPTLHRIAAWPNEAIVDSQGAIRGFVMRRVTNRENVHELYSPKSRFESFAEADFRFILHVATNISRAFAVVHQSGSVIGDINHGHLLVGTKDGTVTLIDCDSFQIEANYKLYTCNVGSPLFTPPELQGVSFRGLRRTPNHDAFGLGVLLFHLLFMGRHPYAGRYSGKGEMPVEKAISEDRFAYGAGNKALLMERPPGTIPLAAMGPDIAALFEACFSPKAHNGGRPDASAWITALRALSGHLKQCKATASHHYYDGLKDCPWCSVERQTAVRLFGQRTGAFSWAGVVDVAALWSAIVAVKDPGPEPQIPQSTTSARTAPRRHALLRIMRKRLACALFVAGVAACTLASNQSGELRWGLVLVPLALAIWPWTSGRRRVAADAAVSAARSEWNSVLTRWQREASRAAFAQALKELEETRANILDLPRERQRRIAKLEADRETQQKQKYLDRFRIDRATIPGIGQGRTAMLASYGVETAADITRKRVQLVPGFGPTLTSSLLTWRATQERNFRFDPKQAVDPRLVADVDREIDALRKAALSKLRRGPGELTRLGTEIVSARQRLRPFLERARASLQEAENARAGL